MRRLLQKPNWLLSLLLGCVLLAGTPGCNLLFPPDNNGPVEPDKPDDKTPDSGIKDTFKVRPGALAAIKADNMDRADILLLYGLCDGVADYITLTANENLGTTHTLGKLMDGALTHMGWTDGKYQAWKAEISRVWAANELKEPIPLADCRTKVVDMFRLLALGCKDALKDK